MKQRWARSGFARQYQYQHFCKGQMHDNTNIKIETTPILLANINIKNVDFDYAFKFNINIWKKRKLNINTKIKIKIHSLKINVNVNIQKSVNAKSISILTDVDSSKQQMSTSRIDWDNEELKLHLKCPAYVVMMTSLIWWAKCCHHYLWLQFPILISTLNVWLSMRLFIW